VLLELLVFGLSAMVLHLVLVLVLLLLALELLHPHHPLEMLEVLTMVLHLVLVLVLVLHGLRCLDSHFHVILVFDLVLGLVLLLAFVHQLVRILTLPQQYPQLLPQTPHQPIHLRQIIIRNRRIRMRDQTLGPRDLA
jgi:hypothetical protein